MSAWRKFLRVIGFEFDDDDPDGNDDGHETQSLPTVSEEWVEELSHGGKKRGTLVSLPGQKQLKVIVIEPQSFEESPGIADHLKSRRPVIVNLESTDREHAQRILNFLSGCTYALGGEMQRISNGIFFFAPSNVDVTKVRRTLRGADESAATSDARSDFVSTHARDFADRKPVPIVPPPMARQEPRPELVDERRDDRGIPLWHK